MKKLLYVIPLVVLLCSTFACQNKAEKAELEKMKAMAQTEEQNKAVVHQFFEALDSQNFNRFIELLAPGAVLHGARPEEDITAQNAAQYLEPFYRALPDLTHNIEDIFAKGDKVVARGFIQATHKAELQGIPATGNRLKYYQIAIFQVVDGKIREAWNVTDSLGMMQQLDMELKPKETGK